MKIRALVVLLLLLSVLPTHATDKPKLTLDEFFNFVGFTDVKISPDGRAVVIGTLRADWDQSIFRKDLWLYRDDASGNGTLTQLTQSGHDAQPQWSPDGRWIAFLSERKTEKKESDSNAKTTEDTAHVYLISSSGGEAFPVTLGEEEVHAFSWSPDSRILYFAIRAPWTKAQKDAYKKEWKDVSQYRDAERGDTISGIAVADALSRNANAVSKVTDDSKNESDPTPGSHVVASTPWRVEQIVTSPDGGKLAFVTTSVSERQEKVSEFEIYAVDLTTASPDRPPHQVTHNEAVENNLHWASDNRHIFFTVEVGDVTGHYRDLQPHLHWADIDTGEVRQWAKDFPGAVDRYDVAGNQVLVAGKLGTEVPLYSSIKPSDSLAKLNGWSGTYERLSAAEHSPRVALVYSSLEKPTEVYLAESPEKLEDARPITAFNKLFAERDLPQGKPYKWKADDGTTVEGMLIYPPGKFETKNLPMFVLIHGGPADADGNHFEADWYQWDRLAATQGWLVFEPNYRGSAGYGDTFLTEIVPQIVSRPGKDILEGVDALVKDGIADPKQLTVGGYSYGGYMT
ncbi:MAG: hypothetical protein DMG87_11750, partial [Acidobacteria bacterium]